MKKNLFYNILLTSSNFLFPLLTFPYLSRIFGADGLGVCNFIISYGQNFIIIAALGLPVYGVREIAKVGNDHAKRSTLFIELLCIHLLFTLIILLIYISTVFLFSDLYKYKDIALIGGTLILFNVFSIEWLFSGINDFKYITIRSLMIKIISIGAILIFVRSKGDILIYFIILFITAFLTSILDLYSAKRFISFNTNLSFTSIKQHINPIGILGIYLVMTSIYSVLPATLLGFLSSKASVGYYYGANKIIRMMISFFTALITIMIPKLNFLFEKKENIEYLSLIENTLTIVISLGIPITFLVFLLAKPLVLLLAGIDFFNSIAVIQIMAPIILIVALAQVFVLLILSVHRQDKQMVILSSIGMTVSLFINILFIHSFAEMATGFSQLISEFLVTVFSFFIAKKLVNFYFPIKLFLLNLLCALPFAFISYLSIQVFKNNIMIIAFSSILGGVYFILYQKMIIKDPFLLTLMRTTLFKKS